MYFGGKGVIYQNPSMSTTTVESIPRGLTYCLKDRSGKHHKERLRKFSRDTGIALNEHGFLDVKVIDDPTEIAGATQSPNNGENSPRVS